MHGEYFAMSQVDNGGAVIGPDALSRTLSDIDRLVMTGSDSATQAARTKAKLILSEAQLIKPIYLMASAIECSEGDVLIHWDTIIKSVVLIANAAGDRSQIYREILNGKSAAYSEIAEASPMALSEALTWILQPK
jgi:hypothetical protein